MLGTFYNESQELYAEYAEQFPDEVQQVRYVTHTDGLYVCLVVFVEHGW